MAMWDTARNGVTEGDVGRPGAWLDTEHGSEYILRRWIVGGSGARTGASDMGD